MNNKTETLESERRRLQVWFLLPLLISMIVLIVLPMLSLFGLSFTNYKLNKSQIDFNFLDNYIKLFKDDNFINACKNTLIFLTITVVFQMIIGTLGAMAIQKTKFCSNIIRSLIILPMVIPPVIAGLIWKLLLVPKYGGVDFVLTEMGFVNLPEWLANPISAKAMIIIVTIWEWMPFVVLFVLAALESLPASPYEAIKIDGANLIQEIRYLTLPLIKPILSFVLVFRLVEGLKVFPLVFSLTKGGPGRNTEELTYFAYNEGFKYFRTGYASASAMIMFAVLIAIIVLLYGRKKTA